MPDATVGPKFKVEHARAVLDCPNPRWTITEDGRHECPVTWASRDAALDRLTAIRRDADACGRHGYYQGDTRIQVFVLVNRQRVNVTLPDEFITATSRQQETIRRDAIRTAVIRHLIDQETGDPS